MAEKSSDRHRLAGVIEKFNRSKKQFDELLSEMDAFFNKEPKPHFSLGEFDTDAWEWVERFQIREEPPLRLGVILGDVLHNLRSALDHLMWQVTLLDGGTPDDSTQFPIASKSEDQFNRMAKRRIPGVSAEHRAIVKHVQPYHAGDEAHRHPLAVLATLANVDKHQVVHATYSFIAGDTAEAVERLIQSMKRDPSSPAKGAFLAKHGERMEHGTPWLRIVWDRGEEPPREVNVGGNVPLGIAFGEIGLDSKGMPEIAEAVKSIIQRFQADFPETEFVD